MTAREGTSGRSRVLPDAAAPLFSTPIPDGSTCYPCLFCNEGAWAGNLYTTCVISAMLVQAREVLGESLAAADSAADSQPAAQATTEAAAGSGEETRAGKPRHTQGYSFFQPFQAGMQQASAPV